ncbi:N-formyl peptide receptor 2-like [Stylophora pistillata]|uniref:N-formyl peptide receptor 2-like n=1 Tax=Stylophora pistillata TaxID=50429 RepID=UPI000C0461F3|nr:N-formyl peptide receptor 2-like [Stylophora pistillata]
MATVNSSTNLTDARSEYYAQLLPIAGLIAFVNGVVFVLFAKDKHLRTPANYLLFSLAVCDFMTGLINLPLTIIVFTRVLAPQPAAIVIAFLPITWFYRFICYQEDVSAATLQIQTGHNIFSMVIVFLLPYTVMVYFQVIMFRKIQRRSFKSGKRERLSCSAVNRKVKNTKRSLIIFALMAFFYAICWFPWYLVSLFINLWFRLSYEAQNVLWKFAHAFVIMRYLASIVNPALYTFLKRDFFESFKTIVLRRTSKKRNNSQATSLITERRVNSEYAPGPLKVEDEQTV